MARGSRTRSRRSSLALLAGAGAAGGLTLAGLPIGGALIVGLVAALLVGACRFLSWSPSQWADWFFTVASPWLAHRLWLYRVGLLPVWLAVVLLAGGWGLTRALTPPVELVADAAPAPPHSPWWPLPAAVGLAGALTLALAGSRFAPAVQRTVMWLVPDAMDDGRPGLLDRPTERLYVAVTLLAAGGWLAARLWYGLTEGVWWALVVGTAAYAAPWWWHRGYRRRRVGGRWRRRWARVEGSDRAKLWKDSRIVETSGTKAATTLLVRLKAGVTVREVSGDALVLSSILGLRPGAVTIGVDKSAARRVKVRIVPRDPWRGVLPHPLPRPGSLELADSPRVRVGDYEDATADLLKLQQHMLVVGQTGSGKSVMLETILGWIVALRHARVVAADLAGGATLGIWEPVLAAPLAVDAPSAVSLLGGVFREVERREAELARRKRAGELIDVLPADEDNPALFCMIDEFPDLVKACKAAGIELVPLLERLANKARKVNIWLILGAQNPTAHDVGSTELRGALTCVIGLGLSERQSMTLWGSQRSDGWDSTPLRTGTYLLSDRDEAHAEPRVAKGLWISPARRAHLIAEATELTSRRLPPAGQRLLDEGGDPTSAAPAVTPHRRPVTPPVAPPAPPPASPPSPPARGETSPPASPPVSPPTSPPSSPAPATPLSAPRTERPAPARTLVVAPAALEGAALDEAVWAELPDAGQPTVEVRSLADQLDVSRDKVNRALARLRRDGRVVQHSRGRWERINERENDTV